jgi:hypothetical protein
MLAKVGNRGWRTSILPFLPSTLSWDNDLLLSNYYGTNEYYSLLRRSPSHHLRPPDLWRHHVQIGMYSILPPFFPSSHRIFLEHRPNSVLAIRRIQRRQQLHRHGSSSIVECPTWAGTFCSFPITRTEEERLG